MASENGTHSRALLTTDRVNEVLRLEAEGGPELVAKRLGYTHGYSVQLIRRCHVVHDAGKRTKASTKVKRPASATALSKAVGRFVDDCRYAKANGNGTVMLGNMEGFPNATDDPKIVARAIAAYEKRLTNAAGVIAELKLRQRIMDLRAAIEYLESASEAGVDADREIFVAYGAEWAETNGISYNAFREMGVPAGVLREAGIGR